MLPNCRICCQQVSCCICGNRAKISKKETKEEAIQREHLEYLYHVHAKLRRAQAKSTGNLDLDMEILLAVGSWYDPPKPMYVSKIKQLYDEAYLAEIQGNRNLARSLYKKLLWEMKETDKINYKTGKAEIEAKVKEFSKG